MAVNTTQSGILSASKTFDDIDLMRGMFKLDNSNIGNYDIQIGGYAMFKWVNMPTFMELTNPSLTKRFRNLTEKGSTSLDGIQDIAVQSEDITGGLAGNSFKVVTNVKDDFDTFSMKVYELNGSPIREAISYWVDGVRDRGYGTAQYHGIVDTIEGGYSAKNHTAELLYIVTNPSLSYNAIEYACLITNIFPTKIPMSHLNYSHGEHPVISFDLEFTAKKYESKYINQKAVEVLKAQRKLEQYSNYNPGSLASV